ncbi:hypothetical protein E2C01_087790 [Portunus trituberculatus]|uniref:Uncharacterized protein n=1 Tax=Portunus trituberculatus TaxID=210409 RepID=A0A5B7JF09_PORTR|nr:hypothetical protein [Portunus trituberculatus]
MNSREASIVAETNQAGRRTDRQKEAGRRTSRYRDLLFQLIPAVRQNRKSDRDGQRQTGRTGADY